MVEERCRVANAGGTTFDLFRLTNCLSPRGSVKCRVKRECGQDYMVAVGFESPGRETGMANVLSPLVAQYFDVALRMQVKLQPYKLEVAGSSPVGSTFLGSRSSVVEHDVSPILVSARH